MAKTVKQPYAPLDAKFLPEIEEARARVEAMDEHDRSGGSMPPCELPLAEELRTCLSALAVAISNYGGLLGKECLLDGFVMIQKIEMRHRGVI